MTKADIAKAFSNGEFEKAFSFLSDNSEWIVVEENTFKGKKAIIENCTQVGNYFKSVTTNFKTHNIIVDGNNVVINGFHLFPPVMFMSLMMTTRFKGSPHIVSNQSNSLTRFYTTFPQVDSYEIFKQKN